MPTAGFSARPDLNIETSAYRLAAAALQQHWVLGGLGEISFSGFLLFQTRVISMYLCTCTFIYAKYKNNIIQPPGAAFGPYKPALHTAPTSQPSALHRSPPERDGGAEPHGKDTMPSEMSGKSRITGHCGSSVTMAMPCKDLCVTPMSSVTNTVLCSG